MKAATILLALSLWASSAAPEDTDSAERHLSNIGYSKLADVFRDELQATGLADADIERIVSDAIDNHAKCIMEIFRESSDPLAKSFLEMLADGLSESEIDAADRRPEEVEAFFATADPLIKECEYETKQQLGTLAAP